MKTFKFVGRVYFTNPETNQRESLFTTITIEAPSSKVARAIINNYGIETVKIQF